MKYVLFLHQVISELVQSTLIQPSLREPVLPQKKFADFTAPNTGLDSDNQRNIYQE